MQSRALKCVPLQKKTTLKNLDFSNCFFQHVSDNKRECSKMFLDRYIANIVITVATLLFLRVALIE